VTLFNSADWWTFLNLVSHDREHSALVYLAHVCHNMGIGV